MMATDPLDLELVASRLGMPLLHDADHGLYTLGPATVSGKALDSAEVPEVSTLDDLLGSEFRGKVALNGDPTQAGAAFSGVVMAAVSNGGSADVSLSVRYRGPIDAPVKEGQQVAWLRVTMPGQTEASRLFEWRG